ncbi:low specificity L-threonine aldolase [Conexibacter sp. DBS9H8]|uniref:threonine aldolase family protein n=1 Tax=Conexibacter sp. DBS9H8 TaxID=2937801 RepID=UPI00200D0328|nr:beta-eliminating lyase-related protein [Conexibacter sp. DBS9H8]
MSGAPAEAGGEPRRGFASDNTATIHPAVLERIAAVNAGHAFGYGHDPYSTAVAARVAAELGGTEAFFVFNGSGANVVSLRACCRPWQAVVCSEHAHIHTDESGAPEAVGGLKLLTVTAPDGRLSPDAVADLLAFREADEHAVLPRVLSITQSTELGTVHSRSAFAALTDLAHEHGMLVHVDGARLANAAVTRGVSLAELVEGADIVSFGGTKNGLMGAEAIVVLNPALTEGMLWLRKQSLQLASKMRFLAAQFDALLDDGLWQANAAHANGMAQRLAAAVGDLPGVQITRPVEANAVFAVIARNARERLLGAFDFYPWDERTGEVRWMCSWDTTAADVDAFAAAVADATAVARV